MKLVVVDLGELKDIVRDTVADVLADLPRATTTAPSLLDRKALAAALDISPAALDRLRGEASFPEIRVGDAPRFELDRVLDWLRTRSREPALRVVSG